MEKGSGDEKNSSLSSSPKSKSKNKSLCKLLMQKKSKVGCLFSHSDDLTLFNSPSSNKSLKHGSDTSILKTRLSSSMLNLKEMESHSSKETVNNTKLSLCCTMTEGSCSCSLQPSKEREMHVFKTDSKTKEISRRLSLEEKVCVGSINREFNDSKSKIEREESRRKSFSKSLSTSPTQSEMSSHTSSSSNLFIERRSKKFFFAKRRSVDNLLSVINPSTSNSSPTSCRSAPDSYRFKIKSSSNETSLTRKEEKKLLPSGSETTSESSAGSHCRGFVASMDSLARHSLLAAEVLHLIPTIKARERNFLHGRIAANSLLGPVELERTLPHRELRIFVGTWNMNGQAPPEELNDFILPPSLEHMPDVIVVGTQESYSERFEWEVSIQETLGPSHLLFHSAVLGTLHLAVFIRRDLLWFCSVPEEASYSVRPGTAFRTKGAVAIGFTIFGTSYLCITSHLTAHMDKVKERIQDVKRIVRSLDLPKVVPIRNKSKDVTQNFDYVFWCGDLNFRLSQPRDEVVQWVAEQQFPLPLPHSLHSDQLKLIIAEGSVFTEFLEGPITFPPTYKYDPGTQNFDTSHKQRTPAYTDRILYKCKGRGVLECLYYSSVTSMCTSDHKPVWGLYSSAVRPGIDTIPLAAGLFHREVYLEGVKRRAAALERGAGTSAVCSLQ